MIVLYKGTRGDNVKQIQEALDITADGIFGPITEVSVKKYQTAKGLYPDGVVGPKTWTLLEAATTDNSEQQGPAGDAEGFIKKHYLPKGQYLEGPSKKEYIFLHHTAGWHSPYKTIDNWGRDDRGRIATEFVIGGQDVRDGDDTYDGEVVQCIPTGGYAWHLGKNGSQQMHVNSVGIELCGFGYIVDGKTYANHRAHESQIVELDQPFKGRKYHHRYSDKQISNLKKLLVFIGERDNIDLREGLPRLIREQGLKAFEWNEDAYYGRIKGILSHTNTNKWKSDVHPQQELIDMLLSL